MSTDIAALMASDPSKHTDADIDNIVEEYRNNRKFFKLGNKSAGNTKPKAKKTNQAKNLGLELDLKLEL